MRDYLLLKQVEPISRLLWLNEVVVFTPAPPPAPPTALSSIRAGARPGLVARAINKRSIRDHLRDRPGRTKRPFMTATRATTARPGGTGAAAHPTDAPGPPAPALGGFTSASRDHLRDHPRSPQVTREYPPFSLAIGTAAAGRAIRWGTHHSEPSVLCAKHIIGSHCRWRARASSCTSSKMVHTSGSARLVPLPHISNRWVDYWIDQEPPGRSSTRPSPPTSSPRPSSARRPCHNTSFPYS